MAIQKTRLRAKTRSGIDTIHLETSSDLVVRPDGSSVEEGLKSKADRYNRMIDTPATYNDVIALGPGEFEWVQAGAPPAWEPSDIPVGTLRFALTSVFTASNHPKYFRLRCIDGAYYLREWILEPNNAAFRYKQLANTDMVESIAFKTYFPNKINYDNTYDFNGVSAYSDNNHGTVPPYQSMNGGMLWKNVLTLNSGYFFSSQLCIDLNSTGTMQNLYFRSIWYDHAGSDWFQWLRVVVSTLPAEQSLTMKSGFTSKPGATRCIKSQEGIVTVNIGIYLSNGSSFGPGDYTVAQMPENCTPSADAYGTAWTTSGNTAIGITVNTSGEVLAHVREAYPTDIHGSLSFRASTL